MNKRKVKRKKKYSRSDVRTLTLLAIIEGAVLQAKMSADPLIYNRVEYAQKHCQIAVNSWYVKGSELETIKKVKVHLDAIEVNLNGIWWLKAKPEMNTPGMIYIGMQLLDDLMLIVKQPKRNIKLQNIHDALTVLIDQIDPEGEMHLTQDRAKEVVDAVYNVIGEKECLTSLKV